MGAEHIHSLFKKITMQNNIPPKAIIEIPNITEKTLLATSYSKLDSA